MNFTCRDGLLEVIWCWAVQLRFQNVSFSIIFSDRLAITLQRIYQQRDLLKISQNC